MAKEGDICPNCHIGVLGWAKNSYEASMYEKLACNNCGHVANERRKTSGLAVDVTPRISTRITGSGVPQYDNYFESGI